MHILKSEDYRRAPESAKLACLKLLEWAHRNSLRSVDMVVADETYYNKSLEQRRDILKAPSTKYLCKTIILENTAYDEKLAGPHYPRYICVVFQYVTKFHSEKLARLIKQNQNNNCEKKASGKNFHYRLVEEELSAKLSGYEHNGVVPILTATKMPTIISHRIEQLQPQFFWLGGGHPITKLRISLADFKATAEAPVLIGDITQ